MKCKENNCKIVFQVHNSVVITVLRRGILDLSVFLLITSSWTSQGEISSILLLLTDLLMVDFMLFFMLLEEVPLNESLCLFSLLLITLLEVLFMRDSVLFEFIFLIIEFLLAFDPDLARFEAETKHRSVKSE